MEIFSSRLQRESFFRKRGKSRGTLDGISVKDLTLADAQQMGISPKIRGVLVSRVREGSRAERAGLQVGDVIMQINRKQIAGVDSYKETLKGEKGKSLVLLINRHGQTFFIVINR